MANKRKIMKVQNLYSTNEVKFTDDFPKVKISQQESKFSKRMLKINEWR